MENQSSLSESLKSNTNKGPIAYNPRPGLPLYQPHLSSSLSPCLIIIRSNIMIPQYKDVNDKLDSTAKHKTNSHGGRYNNPYVHITTPTSASDKRSKDKVLEVLNRCGKKVEDVTRKAEALAGGLKDHLKFSPSISDAAMARLSQGTKMIVEGGPERVFQREFGVLAAEKLLDSFVCYLSTTSGPVTGVIYISNRRIAFCSDYAIRLPSSAGGNGVAAYYKVVMEWEKISSISSSTNVLKPSERYVHMVTQDGFEFWFMGFVSYVDAFNCLNKALLNSRSDHHHRAM